MMGIKDRSFAALPRDISLEELVPKENFYRRLQSTLDLSFVRDLVRPLYAGAGRPSVDPVVFFKLQLVMLFEDLRSERQLMSVVADRRSLRWYLGYDLHELLFDPHPQALRPFSLQALLRADRGAMRRGGAGVG
jgi:transposase